MAPQFKWFERLPDVCLITPVVHSDARGYFVETYSANDFRGAGIDVGFVQDNHSLSKPHGTLRGLHFQTAPYGQAKLVRCLRGAILDVVVDIRQDSQTRGKHVSVELSAENMEQLYVPEGFAHGFCTLMDDTEVAYKVSSVYSASHDRGIDPFDPALAIPWPVSRQTAVLSEKDKNHPALKAYVSTIGAGT